MGYRGTENTGGGKTPVIHLTGTPMPLLTEGCRKQDRLVIESAFLTLAICITNPCKVNPGSNGMLLQERSEHIGIREKGGNPVMVLNKG